MLPELREDSELFEAAGAAQFGISPVLGLRPLPGRERAVMEKLNAAIRRATARETALDGTASGIFHQKLSGHTAHSAL